MSIFNRFKRTISIILFLALSLSILAPAGAATAAKDEFKGHWAETQLRDWAGKGLLNGYNGVYAPDRAVTRAEFVTLINRSFQLSESGEMTYSDVPVSHWAYNQLAVAVKFGYITGYPDKTIHPNQTIIREEAAVMVAKLLGLTEDQPEESLPFKDSVAFSSWSKKAIWALAGTSVILGNANGNFDPKGNLTRAEAVVLLNKASTYATTKSENVVYNKAGVYGPATGTETIKGNVTISVPGITLQNVNIEGNLTLTAGVGNGDAFFKKVTVKGDTLIQGGGENSIHFEDSVLVRISINKRDGTVRVVVAGDSAIQSAIIHSPVKLEESSLTNTGFANVEISEDLPANSKVQLIGQYEDVQVKTSDIKISIPDGSVKKLDVAKGITNTEITLDAKASIMDLVLNAVVKLLGQGKVDKATINSGAKGSSFETRPSTLAGEAADTITSPSTSTPAPSGNNGGGDNGGGNNGGGNNGGGDNGGGNNGGGNNGGGNNGGGDNGGGDNGGGNNGGGDNGGGDNGGGDNPCTGTPAECKATNFSQMELSSFTLNQLSSDYKETGDIGFNPNVYSYSAVITDKVETTLTVTKATYSKVTYNIWDRGSVFIKSGEITDSANSFQLEVSPQQDYRIRFVAQSGDKVSTKVYEVFLQYPRTLQESLKIGSNFVSYVDGTVKKQFNLQRGAYDGKALRVTDAVYLYEDESSTTPFLVCSNFSCPVPQENIPNDTGIWKVEIYRDAALLIAGSYEYNFNPAPLLTDDIGLLAKAYTKQELIDEFKLKNYYPMPLKYGYRLFLNPADVRKAHSDAKYVTIGSYTMNGSTTAYPAALTYEELKIGIQPSGYPGYEMLYPYAIYYDSMAQQDIYGAVYLEYDYQYESKVVNDAFIIVGLYDVNFKLIGQYITVLEFDQNHIADGYTAAENWQPAP